MATNEIQTTLDRLREELKSREASRCLSALEELDSLKYSSPAILSELEQIALHHAEAEVRQRARQSLGTHVHQFIRSRINRLDREQRGLLVKQIEQWEKEDLLEADVTDVLKRRYNFDFTQAPAAPKPPVATGERPFPAPAAPQSVPPVPRLSLTQTLLSEASIKIYLYLGAFFVIASALILAAVVEAARLPILTLATLGFGGTAFLLHKRLPQPSFALFIVFSFLLPIDANVLEETIGLTEPGLSVYWTIVLTLIAGIWGFSVWFYESRFFSAVAFAALSLALYRFGWVLSQQLELQLFLGVIASLAGLAGTFVLMRWKDHPFSMAVFLLAQIQVLGVLFVSLVFAAGAELGLTEPIDGWLLFTLTWLAAASFYALSDFLRPGLLFPWLAAAALLPLPWFFLRIFEVTQQVYSAGFWLWGAIFALISEAALWLPGDRIKKFHWPALAGSVPLILTSFFLALARENPLLLFVIFTLTALIYTALHLARPRWYVWSTALLAALFAFFTFFQLPAVERLEVPPVYQWLIAGVLLAGPELFTKSPLSLKGSSRWPSLAFGVFVSIIGLMLALVDLDRSGRGALALIVYTVLFIFHGLHGKREWLGYFAAATGSLAVIYLLDHFSLDLWLPAMTALTILFYSTGYLLRRTGGLNAWGSVLINSGLSLGILLALTTLLLLKETSGWYVALIALLFAVEIFARPLAVFEVLTEVLLTISLFLILEDFNAQSIGHFLFAASLIWLGGDLVFGRLIQENRFYRPATLSIGYALVFVAGVLLWSDSDLRWPTVYFSLYFLFFAFQFILLREPALGYFATGFLSLATLKFCQAVGFERWTFPLIALSVLYYVSGSLRRQNRQADEWAPTLLYSGLALGALTSLGAPFQGGLDASLPVAIAATLFAAEAFARRNVWWALPANGLYLLSYFMILIELDVDEPQFYSIGAALLGMLMHFLLTRAGSKTGAFIAGMLSQLVLLGTTYIQMISTEHLLFFFVLFVQSMVVLIYGLIQRSRSLVITPIAFAVVGVMTVVYSALKGLGPVILIGSTGLVLLMAGIVAVLMRERITKLGEQLSDWKP